MSHMKSIFRLCAVWGHFLGGGSAEPLPNFGGPQTSPKSNTHKSKNMASSPMRSSLLSLLLEHSFEEEETATMLITLLHPGEATT